MLDEKEIASILAGKLVIDCPRIELIPVCASETRRSLTGGGAISLNEKGDLQIKIYLCEVLSIQEAFESLECPTGKIIDDKYYYKVEAHDLKNRVWRTNQFLPSKSSGPSGSVISGKVRVLEYIDECQAANRTALQMYFDDPIQIPRNAIAKTRTTIGDSVRSESNKFNIALFNAIGITFDIEKLDAHTTLKASSEGVEFDDDLVNSIFEAFRFVTAYPGKWKILMVRTGDGQICRIRSSERNGQQSRILPPILPLGLPTDMPIWNLFEKYLAYVVGDKAKAWQPIPTLFLSILESGKASLDIECLVLSVSIESLIKETLEHVNKAPEQLLSDIRIAKKLISSDVDISKQFKDRMNGTLGGMKHPRPKDVLYSLQKSGLIGEELIKIYSSLRNKTAHGVRDSDVDIQRILNDAKATLVLFYQLIFLLIGYQGEYTDYTKYNYPRAKFLVALPRIVA